MNWKATLSLVLILTVLSGYVYFFERSPDNDNEAANSSSKISPIYNQTYGEYDVIELQIIRSQQSAHFVRTDEAFTRDWRMVQPASLPPAALDQVRVNGAVTRLARLTPSQVITNAINLADYGLASPQLTVTLTISDGQKITLYAGDKTPIDDNRYMRLATDDQTVFLVFSFAVDDLVALLDELPLVPTPLPR